MDAVILSYAANDEFYGMTLATVQSLLSVGGVGVKVTVVETNESSESCGYVYEGCSVIHPGGVFGYNRFMLAGLAAGASDRVLMCNNDLVFLEGSVRALVDAMDRLGLESASPYEPNWHRRYYGDVPPEGVVMGHEIENQVCGWCICASRSMLERTGALDPAFDFWHQDTNYAITLKEAGVQHGLVTSSHVLHRFSQSHRLLGERHEELTHGQMAVIAEKWGWK